MRRALLVACGVAEASTREVNPKQESLEPDQLGNYVRLPYTDAQYSARFVYSLMGDGTSMPVEKFVAAALATRARTEDLEAAAGLWTPPPAPKRVLTPEVEHDIDISEITPKLGGLAYTILNEGPLDGGDRSTTLARLAHLCFEDGLTPEEALAVLESADLEWGKFHARRDGFAQLERMVDRAYVNYE
jgi:hypothetical protein